MLASGRRGLVFGVTGGGSERVQACLRRRLERCVARIWGYTPFSLACARCVDALPRVSAE